MNRLRKSSSYIKRCDLDTTKVPEKAVKNETKPETKPVNNGGKLAAENVATTALVNCINPDYHHDFGKMLDTVKEKKYLPGEKLKKKIINSQKTTSVNHKLFVE